MVGELLKAGTGLFGPGDPRVARRTRAALRRCLADGRNGLLDWMAAAALVGSFQALNSTMRTTG